MRRCGERQRGDALTGKAELEDMSLATLALSVRKRHTMHAEPVYEDLNLAIVHIRIEMAGGGVRVPPLVAAALVPCASPFHCPMMT